MIWVAALVALMAMGYAAALAALFFAQRTLIYRPDTQRYAPEAVGMPAAVSYTFSSVDGVELVAWRAGPAPGKPTILYFQGNGGGLDLRAERFRRLTATGYGLLAVEYRGYGGSSGFPTEDGLLWDGEAGYLEALRLGVAPDRLVVMGESLGTGVAVDVASKHRIGALVLDSPYSSLVDVAAMQFRIFPVRSLMRDRFDSVSRIDGVRAPILMIHGSADAIIPIALAEELYAKAPAPKTFWRVDGAGHLALGLRIPETLAWLDAAMTANPR